MLIGGEQVSAAAVRARYQANPDSRCRIFNAYGPTECTTFAVCYPIPRDFAGDAVPIGRPLPDTGVQVLDPQQRPVASGEAGELYLSGSGSHAVTVTVVQRPHSVSCACRQPMPGTCCITEPAIRCGSMPTG